MGVQLRAFSASALDGGQCSASRPGRFIPRETAPNTRWVGPRAGLDPVVKGKHENIPSQPRRELNPDRLVRSPVSTLTVG